MNYYKNKRGLLSKIFGDPSLLLLDSALIVNGKSYLIINNVIHLEYVVTNEAKTIQESFGEEWKKFNFIEKQHYLEFDQYFDLIDLDSLAKKGICDLGCGIGRWSRILLEKSNPDYIICIDFSDAIYKASENLREYDNVIFIKGDILDLPFDHKIADFMFSLGVLHHTTKNALDVTRKLAPLSQEFLVYLYYSLDNRLWHYKIIWGITDVLRLLLCKIRNKSLRYVISYLIAAVVYKPMIWLGCIFNKFHRGDLVPLYEFYNGKTLERIAQDAYDRFFTSIEQRFSKNDIKNLKDIYRDVLISPGIPYWHFLCRK